jgi:hypothetical protein
VERLVIRHPDQIIECDVASETMPFHVVTADSVVIHHQSLSSSRLAMRVRGGLDANETRRFRILPGAPLSTAADDADSVRVVERDEQYEIANALVAGRVPRAILPARSLALIQAVRLRDGAWAAAPGGGSAIVDLAGKRLRVEGMRVPFLEGIRGDRTGSHEPWLLRLPL